MKAVLTHLPIVYNYADGTFDVSVYILCVNKLLKESERRFKDFEHMNLILSSITHPF
jgi:hypothetical protein